MPDPHLIRRPDPHRRDGWLIYCADVHVGSISRAVGVPGAAERWTWSCGFYPGSKPGEQTHGTADTFDAARADFERAWLVFASRRRPLSCRSWMRNTVPMFSRRRGLI